ncbi:V-type ATPase subunit [Chloroflexota bacterium]
MLDTKYEFISAFLRSGEARVINQDHINRISRASNPQDILAGIIDTDIGNYLQEMPITTFDEVDEYLWRYLRKSVSQIETFQFIPADVIKILRTYIVKYDLRNIKAALFQILTGKKIKMVPVGIIHEYELLDNLSDSENVEDIIEILNTCNLRDYVSVLEANKIEEGMKPSLIAESELDSIYYSNFLNKAKEVKDGFILTKVLGVIIDLTNLQIVSRAIIEGIGPRAANYLIADGYLLPTNTITELLSLKLTDIPDKMGNDLYRQISEEIADAYNKTHSIASIEEIIDTYKFNSIKELLAPRVLSPSVIVLYLTVKEMELRNLRLVLKAVFDNIPPEEIKIYLVATS